MRSPRSVVGRGLIAGAVAGTVIAVWFLVVDTLQGQVLQTPRFLAEVVLGQGAGWGGILLYTVVHYVVFGVLGVAVAAAMARVGVVPGPLVGVVVGFLMFDLMFYGSVLITGVDVVEALGWPAVLTGNVVAGIAMAGTLGLMVEARSVTWWQLLAAHATIREGLMAGLIGAIAVAIWFLVIDAVAGRLFFTPAALGSAVLLRARSLDAVEISAATVLGYTLLHVGAFAVVGLVAAAIIAAAERFSETVLLGGVLLFMTFEAFSIGLLAIIAAWLVAVLSWWSIAVANLIAALGMGIYLYGRHPALMHNLRHVNLEEELASGRR